MSTKLWIITALCVAASGCTNLVPPLPERSAGHLAADAPVPSAPIPQVVEQVPFVPPPEPAPVAETYTVVVNDVPVKELLFALARDAKLNVDVHPEVTGNVTLNAVDQTLDQILDRLSRQVDLRYEVARGTLLITPDTPYYRTYKVDFVNMSRDATTTVTVATQIQTGGATDVAGTGGGSSAGGAGNNNSTTEIESTSNNRFWESLYYNVMSIIGREQDAISGDSKERLPASNYVIINAESGVVTVLATKHQHAEIQAFIDQVQVAAQRQVLIEATIVEVVLNDRYRAGIDWSQLASTAGFSLQQALLPGTALSGSNQFFLLNYKDPDTSNGSLDVTVKALTEFGDTQVLSSPKIMVLNNQTALLKVVNNEVYFTIDVETTSTQGVINTTFDTTPHTVPVGFVMSVTPGIAENDAVMLNVRPTISRIDRFVNDPNPALAAAEVTSPIPVIQTRELESLLRVNSGQTAIMGGLMQDDIGVQTQGIPFLENLPGVGELFKNRDNEYLKSELVIFLRPTVVRNASLEADLQQFKPFLTPGQSNNLAE